MKILGAEKLAKQLRQVPDSARVHVVKAIRRNTEKGAKVARTLVPVASGELKAMIFTQYDQDGMRGSVEAAPRDGVSQKLARAVEFGRKKGKRGKTAANPYMRYTQSFLVKKFKGSIRSAIRKAAKEAMLVG
jgi:hypothetical protein